MGLSTNPRSASIDLGIPQPGQQPLDLGEPGSRVTPSHPYTLESLSASLSTLSMAGPADRTAHAQESLLASLVQAHARSHSPEQEAFPGMELSKGPGLKQDFLSFSN